METINLLAGGPKSEWPVDLNHRLEQNPCIGIDRGTLHLLDMGITPYAAIGDFDSVSANELALIQQRVEIVHQSNPIKDETDTELALQFAGQQFPAAHLTLYGFSGGRLDQLLTNLLMVYRPFLTDVITRLTLQDRHNWIQFYQPGTNLVEKQPGMKYLDFVALEPTTLTLPDEKYQLDRFAVKRPTSFSSNEFLGEQGTFTFDHGIMMVVQSHD
ncbi:thiamine diphosphokinase [Fructilactobacillus cliffordii]|uniref:Thiamine diphosphokinase n=1 Tax=Fructilactobacillus cliffordii TaxID=2940299 RepID=A0A9Q9E3E2_9LACO|nr:thiamine diphosphokinase [Fructilactobacillus cliffordii]USS89692.1 thiamine diphosphokinase [Fructilactobacillus cliffordii]